MAVISATPSAIETLPEDMILVGTIASDASSMDISYVPAVMTSGIMLVDEGLDTEERIGFGTVTDNGDDTATLGDLTRGMSFSADAWAEDTSLAFSHTGGASTVRLVFAHEYWNRIPFFDTANTFSALQTFDELLVIGSKTTAQINALSIANGAFAYDSTLGQMKVKEGGAWNTSVSGTVSTATESAEGKVELATVAEHIPGTSGARVVQAKNIATDHLVYTPGYLTGGTNATSAYETWDNVTDGEFAVTIDGVARDITAIDFSSVTSMAEVATAIQTAIRAETSSTETVAWSTNKFVITSVDTTSSSEVSVTSAVGGGSGTDISGAGATTYMDAETGQGTATAAVLDVTQDALKLVGLHTDGYFKENMLGSGTPSAANVLLGDGSWGNPVNNYSQPVFTSVVDSATLTNPTSETAFATHTYTIPANELIAGVWYEFEFTVSAVYGTSSTIVLGIGLGASQDVYNTTEAATGQGTYTLRGSIMGTVAAGASANVRICFDGASSSSIGSGEGYVEVAKATNGTLAITFFASFGSSHGSNTIKAVMTVIKKVSSSVF